MSKSHFLFIPFQNAVQKIDDTKSTTTVSTEDCSADDKSSLPSKPDSETHNPVPSVSWGSGRSFADILKKRDL